MMMDVVTSMSAEPDFISATVHEKLDDPNTFVIYETWACSREEFLSRHLGRPYRSAYEEQLPSMLSGERQIQFLKPVHALEG